MACNPRHSVSDKLSRLVGVALFLAPYMTAQASPTVLYSEAFEGMHGWTLNVSSGVNGADPNLWAVSASEGGVAPGNCSVANNGNKTLHVGHAQYGDMVGAAYDAGGLCGFVVCPQTNKRSESPSFSTVGQSNITLEFDYIAYGDGLLDNASVLYDAGSGWTVLQASLKSNNAPCVLGQGYWTHASIALPAGAENQSNVRIAFNWTNNDDGVGTDPSVAINDVVVSADPAPTPTNTPPAAPTTTPTATATATVPVASGSCPSSPQLGCFTATKDILTVDNNLRHSTGSTKWRFKQGPTLTLANFGNPMATTSYSMCLYDDGVLVGEASAPASPSLWEPIGKSRGFDYADRGAAAGDIERMRLDTLWGSGLVATGNFFVTPVSAAKMLNATTSVRLQVLSTAGSCFDSTFTPADIRSNRDNYFRAQKK